MSTLRELELEQVSPRLLEVLRIQGLANLTQFQSDSVEKGIMRGGNQILLTYDFDEAYQIAEIAALNRVASDFKAKAVILCPNPYSAEKRFQSVAQKCRRLGIEATAIIRRRTATMEDLNTGRVIVATFRSLSIALRSHPELLENLSCALVDRLDLIGQPEIGASLETVLVTLMGHDRNLQYIAVSPPVADVDELSIWLDANIIVDPKAEVKVIFSVKAFDAVGESLTDLTEFVHHRRGQIMILCPNRTEAERLARQLSGVEIVDDDVKLDLRLTPGHRDELRDLAKETVEDYPDCDMTVMLGRVISRGVAFFHEGVSVAQRRAISDAWEDELLPVIIMPMRFAIASGLRATVVFLMGVFMQDIGKDLSHDEGLTLLTEWQLNNVLQSAGRRGLDNEAFGIVVVDESERHRVLGKYFVEDDKSNIVPREGEVDSLMDDPENIQDLVLSQLCSLRDGTDDPFAIISRTFWATSNRVMDISVDGLISDDDESVETLVSQRSTKGTEKRAQEIPDASVKVVSVNPTKVEGLVHSHSRDLWHHVVLRAAEGVSCTCESWKFQGIRKHRLCKHLVKFANFTAQSDEARPYATSVILQALTGLETLGELEKENLIVREGKNIKCTELGEKVALLGVPVRDAKKVARELSKSGGNLKRILLNVVVTRTQLPRDLVKRLIDSIPPDGKTDEVYCAEDIPGIVENCLEEIQYINSILKGLVKDDDNPELRKEIIELQERLLPVLERIS
ncbi:MAG: hypothetical protein ACXABC_08060 [Candidatus Thorarchaeota archaeon]